MKQSDYKRIMDQLEPDNELQSRLAQGLLEKGNKPVRWRRRLYLAASLLLIISIGYISFEARKSGPKLESVISVDDTQKEPTGQVSPHAITIPKIELPKQSLEIADMVGLIVYKGNIYMQGSSSITPEAATKLRGEKLGRTKAGIDEYSGKESYVELASTIGVTDVFSVKGYDSNFRIMSYQEQEGNNYAELYERLNGITLTNGADLFEKMKLKNNITTVVAQDYDNWNNSKSTFHELKVDDRFGTFLNSLYEAIPRDHGKLYDEGIYNNGEQNQKVLFLTMADQTEITLFLFNGNYVQYPGASVFFEMEPVAFSAIWDAIP